MTGNEYQIYAMRTASKGTDIVSGALGLCGETGEVADIVKKAYISGTPS